MKRQTVFAVLTVVLALAGLVATATATPGTAEISSVSVAAPTDFVCPGGQPGIPLPEGTVTFGAGNRIVVTERVHNTSGTWSWAESWTYAAQVSANETLNLGWSPLAASGVGGRFHALPNPGVYRAAWACYSPGGEFAGALQEARAVANAGHTSYLQVHGCLEAWALAHGHVLVYPEPGNPFVVIPPGAGVDYDPYGTDGTGVCPPTGFTETPTPTPTANPTGTPSPTTVPPTPSPTTSPTVTPSPTPTPGLWKLWVPLLLKERPLPTPTPTVTATPTGTPTPVQQLVVQCKDATSFPDSAQGWGGRLSCPGEGGTRVYQVRWGTASRPGRPADLLQVDGRNTGISLWDGPATSGQSVVVEGTALCGDVLDITVQEAGPLGLQGTASCYVDP